MHKNIKLKYCPSHHHVSGSGSRHGGVGPSFKSDWCKIQENIVHHSHNTDTQIMFDHKRFVSIDRVHSKRRGSSIGNPENPPVTTHDAADMNRATH